ncbi:MAG TPA: HlyD family secretion protein [Verrucomicrobiae bacterium]|jgi:multidrug resistance efflux pump|nr:HlyD family secretion protein [Verrucomicrobiae bacterium]
MAALRIALRILVTLLVVAAAGYVGWRLWDYYTLSPWTRDARVLANVVELAPDVSGLISAINVTDNQKVQKGDVLFVIDQERFKVAVEEAEAVVAQRTQALRLAEDDSRRYASLRAPSIDAVSAQTAERAAIAAEEARAALQESEAALAAAQIDLTRSEVRAPANGFVTNLTASVGDYATVGKGVLAVVDSDSFYVYGYFMETKLPAIHDGDDAEVKLMAGGVVLKGKVEGLSRAIADPDAAGGGLLASVDPEFEWIRLAQRIPVRIRLESVPPGVRLVSGLSCTVVVKPAKTVPASP